MIKSYKEAVLIFSRQDEKIALLNFEKGFQ